MMPALCSTKGSNSDYPFIFFSATSSIVDSHGFGFAIPYKRMNIETPVAINKGSSWSMICNVFPDSSFSNSHRSIKDDYFHFYSPESLMNIV